MMDGKVFLWALETCAKTGAHCNECPLLGVERCIEKVRQESLRIARAYFGVQEAAGEQKAWTREKILDVAKMVVCGHREQDYGTPEDSFGTIANLWTAYMTAAFGDDVEFSAADVAVMLALLKVARLASNPQHMDSWVDLAGYAACGGEINGGDKR